MENKLNAELIEKARQAKSPEELLTLAKENGQELTEEEAKAYFEQMHKTGELSDDELDNVAGGGCHTKDGRLVVAATYVCELWKCRACGGGYSVFHYNNCSVEGKVASNCRNCRYQTYENGLWICNRDLYRKGGNFE